MYTDGIVHLCQIILLPRSVLAALTIPTDGGKQPHITLQEAIKRNDPNWYRRQVWSLPRTAKDKQFVPMIEQHELQGNMCSFLVSLYWAQHYNAVYNTDLSCWLLRLRTTGRLWASRRCAPIDQQGRAGEKGYHTSQTAQFYPLFSCYKCDMPETTCCLPTSCNGEWPNRDSDRLEVPAATSKIVQW